MWVIVGLGNPGVEYAQTRHNVGFMVVETLAHRAGIALRSCGAELRLGRARVGDQAVLLVEPQTFMNRSGEALARCPMDAEDALLVVYDDLDLPSGQIRVRLRGGSAGHRGMESIVQRIGPEFARVRVGIGRPPAVVDAADHVLAPLAGAELTALRADVERASDAVECVVRDGVQTAMNRFNMRPVPATE
jgi:PTH1 family peptidyl-tRNA hydrolase